MQFNVILCIKSTASVILTGGGLMGGGQDGLRVVKYDGDFSYVQG